MNGTVLRCIGGGVLALALWGVTQIGYVVWLCPSHQAWRNAQRSPTSVIVEAGERVRRPYEKLFVCETTHYVGPIAVHRDLDCYCAPEAMSLADIDRSVDGSCVADSSGSAARCALGHCNRDLP